jgi:hypothetical protein
MRLISYYRIQTNDYLMVHFDSAKLPKSCQIRSTNPCAANIVSITVHKRPGPMIHSLKCNYYLNIVHVIFNYYGEKDVIHYLRQNYRYVTDSENNRVQVFATDYYSEKNIRIHPIFMSIKFHHYNNLWN